MVSPALLAIFVAAGIARVASVAVSRVHEKALRARGAVEYGATISTLLAAAHIAFYLAAFAEGVTRATTFDTVSAIGVAILVAAFAMLVWIVRILGQVWTVKIMIAPDHPVSRHALFRYIRHPNYALNIVPELIGYAMVFHAWWTLAVGFPIYLVLLGVRIAQEEKAMQPVR